MLLQRRVQNTVSIDDFNGKNIRFALMDLLKAFDAINHELLIKLPIKPFSTCKDHYNL